MVLGLYLIYLYFANSCFSGYSRSYSAGTGRV